MELLEDDEELFWELLADVELPTGEVDDEFEGEEEVEGEGITCLVELLLWLLLPSFVIEEVCLFVLVGLLALVCFELLVLVTLALDWVVFELTGCDGAWLALLQLTTPIPAPIAIALIPIIPPRIVKTFLVFFTMFSPSN